MDNSTMTSNTPITLPFPSRFFSPRRRYPSDLNDSQWKRVLTVLSAGTEISRQRQVDLDRRQGGAPRPHSKCSTASTIVGRPVASGGCCLTICRRGEPSTPIIASGNKQVCSPRSVANSPVGSRVPGIRTLRRRIRRNESHRAVANPRRFRRRPTRASTRIAAKPATWRRSECGKRL